MNTVHTTDARTAPAWRTPRALETLRAYFASDSRRAVQTALGLIWLLDGGLQFQSFMYSHGFVQMLTGMESGQPHWLSSSVGWGARIANGDLGFWNTLFALTQVAIGLGLLYRPAVKLALTGSFVWVLIVWWFGEAFGMLFMNMANPLTGAPGAVLLYGLVGLVVWPNGRPGGLLGARGSRVTWAVLWCVFGFLWLLGPNSSANATRAAIATAPTGMGWLNHVESTAERLTAGNGLVIALVLAAVSVAIGVAVAAGRQARTFLWLAVYLDVVYWIVGQGFGGLATGSATDPNAGPLLILFACALFPLVARPETSVSER
jgi:hypothetical protein